jgi:hypothetical protein
LKFPQPYAFISFPYYFFIDFMRYVCSAWMSASQLMIIPLFPGECNMANNFSFLLHFTCISYIAASLVCLCKCFLTS